MIPSHYYDQFNTSLNLGFLPPFLPHLLHSPECLLYFNCVKIFVVLSVHYAIASFKNSLNDDAILLKTTKAFPTEIYYSLNFLNLPDEANVFSFSIFSMY